MAYVYNPFSHKLQPTSTDTTEGLSLPVSGTDGTYFFKTDTNTLYIRYTGSWIPVGSSSAVDTYGATTYGIATYSRPLTVVATYA